MVIIAKYFNYFISGENSAILKKNADLFILFNCEVAVQEL